MNIETILPLVTAGTALIAALGGLWKSRNAAKVSDLDTLRTIVNTLQADNEALRIESVEQEVELKELRVLIDTLQAENSVLSEERDELKAQIQDLTDRLKQETSSRALLTGRVAELIDENNKLHQYIGELRESIRNGRKESEP